MIHPQHLLADLQSLLPTLEQDILAYTQTRPELEEHLKAEYAKAKEANRTAEHFVAWREAQITQAAAAWVLTCVFVRFLEDNGLLAMPMLSGPAAESGQGALQQAKDRMTVYFSEHPTHAERDYLLAVFTELETLPALGELLDRAHNPLWRLPLSADGAKALIDFLQRLTPRPAPSSTTSRTRTGTPASSAISIRISRRACASAMRCSRPPSSSSASSSTTPWSRPRPPSVCRGSG